MFYEVLSPHNNVSNGYFLHMCVLTRSINLSIYLSALF